MGDVGKKCQHRTIDCFNFLPSNHRSFKKNIGISIISIDGKNKRKNLKNYAENDVKRKIKTSVFNIKLLLKINDIESRRHKKIFFFLQQINYCNKKIYVRKFFYLC